MKLNEKIRKYRKVFDLSQEELAEKLNVSRQVITKWENELGMPEIENLKALAKLFDVSVDFLLDEEMIIEYPIIKERYTLEKNTYSNRYDYAVSYLKKNYGETGIIYVLSETENGEKNMVAKIFSFITLKISDLSQITQWFSDLAIWFLVETEKNKLLVKVTKEYIETRELSNLIDSNKFTYEKSKFIKISEV